eukprot:scaffold4470_cov255-Prasinococcus_capsulatus_cf.AAC.34
MLVPQPLVIELLRPLTSLRVGGRGSAADGNAGVSVTLHGLREEDARSIVVPVLVPVVEGVNRLVALRWMGGWSCQGQGGIRWWKRVAHVA